MVADGTDYPLIDGKVNGLACKFAPDTGAQITVVPDNLVFQDQVQQTEIERNRDLVPPVSLLADAPTVEQGISQQGPDEQVGLTGSQVGEVNSVEAEVIVGNEHVASGEEIELECLGCPTLVDESDVKLLKKEVMEDDSLKSCRKLGDIKRNGYVWKDGLLFHEMVDETDQTLCRLVLPRPRRQKILRLAHVMLV